MSVTDSVAFLKPLAAGVKIMLIVQLFPAPRLLPQSLFSAKSSGSVPVMRIFLMFMEVLAVLVRTIVCEALACPVGWFPKSILPGTFDFGFATGLSYKDVRLCIDEAEALGVPMVCGAAVRQMLAVTNAMYGADSDFTSMCKVIESWAGVEVRG